MLITHEMRLFSMFVCFVFLACQADCRGKYRKRDGFKKILRQLQFQIKQLKVCNYFEKDSLRWSVQLLLSSHVMVELLFLEPFVL